VALARNGDEVAEMAQFHFVILSAAKDLALKQCTV
jgi:hypothetical protein